MVRGNSVYAFRVPFPTVCGLGEQKESQRVCVMYRAGQLQTLRRPRVPRLPWCWTFLIKRSPRIMRPVNIYCADTPIAFGGFRVLGSDRP